MATLLAALSPCNAESEAYSRGRPQEADTVPHYFNRDGMDALETVLAAIEGGSY